VILSAGEAMCLRTLRARFEELCGIFERLCRDKIAKVY
jgi:hypothetical protein